MHDETVDIIIQDQRRLLAEGVIGPEGHPLAQPEEVEAEAVRQAYTLTTQVDVPLYICCPTSLDAVEIIKEFKKKGLTVIG